MRWSQDLTGVDPQTRHDRLSQIWSWPFREPYQPGGWGKNSIPAIGTQPSAPTP